MGSLFIADIEETCLLADTFERATLLLLGHVVVHWDEKHMNALLACFQQGGGLPRSVLTIFNGPLVIVCSSDQDLSLLLQNSYYFLQRHQQDTRRDFGLHTLCGLCGLPSAVYGSRTLV